MITLRKSFQIKGLNRKDLLIYAVSFPSCVVLFTLAIFHSSVALATAAAFGSALISSFIFSKIFLNEPIGILKGSAFLITVIALFIFTDPFNNFTLSIGLVFAILSGILQGGSNLVQKNLNKEGADKLSLLVLQSFVGVLIGLIVVISSSQDPFFIPGGSPILIFIYGASSVLTIYLFLVGFKYIDLNTGSILVSSQLFFGPALSFIFLEERIAPNVIIGGVLVLIAAVLANWPNKKNIN
jgi:drug/metabolite transporter (DMT)-like permease